MKQLFTNLILCCTTVFLASCTTSPPPKSMNTPKTFRVMTYNIHHGEGVDGQVNLERIAALINEHQPGLVAG